jgi:hypothetical protein
MGRRERSPRRRPHTAHSGALLATTTSFGASAAALGFGQLGRTIEEQKVVSTASLPARWR